MEIQWLLAAAVVAFTATASVTDIRTRKLPNWLTVPAFVMALLFHAFTGGWVGLGQSLAGFAVGFGILLVLWLIGGGGGGDVKLMGALGAWLGPTQILIVFALSTLFVVLGMLVTAFWELTVHGYSHARRRFGPTATLGLRTGSNQADKQLKSKRRILPYAVPVALGTWLFLALKLMAITAEGK